MDSVKTESNSSQATNPLIEDLREKATLVLSILDNLPTECEMDGLLVLQDLINRTVCKMTNGRVSMVRFVPCDAGGVDLSNAWQDISQTMNGSHNLSSCNVIKEEPTDSSWTILEVRGDKNDDRISAEENDVAYSVRKNSLVSSIAVNRKQQSKTKRKCRRRRSYFSPSHKKKQKNVAKESEKADKPEVKYSTEASFIDANNSLPNGSKANERTVKTDRQTTNCISADKNSFKYDEDDDDDDKNVVAATLSGTKDDDKQLVIAALPMETKTSQRRRGWLPTEVKRFQCTDCPYSTNKRIHLEYHTSIHTGTGKFMCKKCNRCFTAASSLQRHTRAHQGIRPFECPVCGKGFVDLASLRAHSVVHTGERLFKCDKCDKIYTNSANLSRHRRVHTGALPYACNTCDIRYRDLSSLKLHVLKHTGEKPYLCHVCNKQFKTSSDYRRHERTHTGERKYSCKQCGRSFTQGWNLKQHERTHGNVLPWKCDACPKAFRSKSSLDHHVRGHAGIKQYQCKICSKWFTTKKYLSDHQVLHTFAKPFRCATCGQRFNQVSNLKRHERIHSDERRYKCNVCGKTFKYINSLQYHEGIHTGARLTCDRCGVSFRCKASIRRHRCRLELLSGERSDGDAGVKAVETVDDPKGEDSISTDDYDFGVSHDQQGSDSTRQTRSRALGQRTGQGGPPVSKRGRKKNADVKSDLKVLIHNIRSEVKDGLYKGCSVVKAGISGTKLVGSELNEEDIGIGNVISVSISDSDGVSYPRVVIKQESSDAETELFLA